MFSFTIGCFSSDRALSKSIESHYQIEKPYDFKSKSMPVAHKNANLFYKFRESKGLSKYMNLREHFKWQNCKWNSVAKLLGSSFISKTIGIEFHFFLFQDG